MLTLASAPILPLDAFERRVAKAWRKVVVPFLVAACVGAAVVAALWLGDGAPHWAPATMALALTAAAIRLWRLWPRPRIAVHWARASALTHSQDPAHPLAPSQRAPRRGPFVAPSEPVREATHRDYASWTAMLIGVAGLLANALLIAFGAPGLPFEQPTLSFGAFLTLLSAGLYWRP